MKNMIQAKLVSLSFFTVVVVAVLVVGAVPGYAELRAKSSATTPGGYPSWFQDQAGMALQGCLNEPARVPILCLLPDPFLEQAGFKADQPKVFPFNFPIEHFYFLANTAPITLEGGGTATVEFALEGAFNPEIIANPNQEMFHRMRLLIEPNTSAPQGTYTVVHPWGTTLLIEDVQNPEIGGGGNRGRATVDSNVGSALGNILSTNDNFAGVLGNDPLFTISNFVTQSDPPPPAGFLGDCNTATPRKVTGGVNGFNKVEIYDPNGDRIGETDLFVVCGQKVGLDVTPSTATFGIWKLGAPSTPSTFSVTNLSGAEIPTRNLQADPQEGLILTSANPAFSIVNDGSCADGLTALGVDSTCSFDVVFTPGVEGAASSIISIISAGNSTLSVSVNGSGDGTAPSITLGTGQTTYTNAATATISGTVTDNEGGAGVAGVKVAFNGAAPAAASLSGSNWSFTSPELAVNSTTSVVITASDNAQLDGNLSTVNSTIIQDSIPPLVTVSSPEKGSFIKTSNPALTFSTTDANNPFTTVSVNDTALDQVPANLALTTDGPHTVTVDTGDSAGNHTIVTNTFTVDTKLPIIAVTSPAPINGRLGITNPVLTFSVNDTNHNAASTVVRLNNAVVANPVSGVTTLGPFTPGFQHTLTVDATDLAGNFSTSAVAFTINYADGRITSLGSAPPSIADALLALKHAVEITPLTGEAFAHADVAPLDTVTGVPSPNGTVDIADALVILRRVVGLVTSF